MKISRHTIKSWIYTVVAKIIKTVVFSPAKNGFKSIIYLYIFYYYYYYYYFFFFFFAVVCQ